MLDEADTELAPEWIWVSPEDESIGYFAERSGAMKRRVIGWKVNPVVGLVLALIGPIG